MNDIIHASGVIPESIVDGPGIRYVIFTQGCPHNCPGCQNPQTHAFHGGKQLPVSRIVDDIRHDPLVCGVTLSGGEPMCQPKPLAQLAEKVNSMGKNVIVYSGYTFEELMGKNDPDVNCLLNQCRYLIDGPFLEDKKSLMLPFRGSTNQRIIDVPSSLKYGQAVEACL